MGIAAGFDGSRSSRSSCARCLSVADCAWRIVDEVAVGVAEPEAGAEAGADMKE